MRVEDFPNLMVAKRLIAPVDLSLEKLREISSLATNGQGEVVRQGLMVLAVASMEIMLGDVLEYLLRSFPQKLPSSEFVFDKEVFFGNYSTLLKKAVETHVVRLSYKSFEEFFAKAMEYLGLEWLDFLEVFGNDIKEIKATRNLLLHNNLVTNDQYLDAAGPTRRASGRGKHLSVGRPYLEKAVSVLVGFEEQLRAKLTEKYKDYTKVRAAKHLWMYLFHSPVMQFDEFWKYSEVSDRITAFRKTDFKDILSNSETLLLSMWLAHFNGNAEYLARLNMRHFDSEHQEKVFLFLSVAAEFDFA